jgi:OOP family OmpA-OmpF porin
MRSLKMLFFAAAVALVALPVAAADNGWYLGASVTQSQLNTGTLESVKVEGDDHGYKVFAGYRILTFLSVEGAYNDLGSIKDVQPIGNTTVDMQAWTAEAVGYIPLGIADIFGKAGLASWSSDYSATGGIIPATASKSGTDPVYGAGVQFRISSWAIRGEVEYFDVKDTDNVYQYSIGASYTF